MVNNWLIKCFRVDDNGCGCDLEMVLNFDEIIYRFGRDIKD